MNEEVSNTQILQAVIELSGEVKVLSNKVDALEVHLTETEVNLNARMNKLDLKIDEVERNLNVKMDKLDVKIDDVEKRLDQKISTNGEKIDRFDDKLSIVTDELLSTKADVKRLKNVQ